MADGPGPGWRRRVLNPTDPADQEMYRRLVGGVVAPAEGTASDQPQRSQIVVTGRQLRDIVDAARDAVALAAPWLGLYIRGGGLVRLSHDHRSIEPISRAGAMLACLVDAADWVTRTRTGSLTNARPPRELPGILLASHWHPRYHLRELERIVHAPVISAGGEVITTPGYHPDERLWYEPAPGLTIPPINRPTRVDVERALHLILVELLRDYPWASPADRAHAVALLLLPAVRSLIDGPTPLHGIEASMPGAGKGLLCDCVSTIHLGHGAIGATAGRDESEMMRTITALLQTGRSLIVWDNVERLDSQALAAALTLLVWTDRLIRSSQAVTLPISAAWVATGNNPQLSREIARRYIRSRLEPSVERPQDLPASHFRHHPLLPWVLDQRGELLWALLVLARSWVVAGRPAGSQTLGSYESWAAVIGGILEHVGIEGFLANRQEVHDHVDLETELWTQLCTTWWQYCADARVSADDLATLARFWGPADILGDGTPHAQRTRLGKALTQRRGAIYGQWRIERQVDRHLKCARYRLVVVDGGTSTGDAGAGA